MAETSVVQKLFYEEKAFRYLLYTEVGLLLFAVACGIILEYRGWRKKLLPCMLSGSQTNYSTEKDRVFTKCLSNGSAESANSNTAEHTQNSSDDILGLLAEYNDFHDAWVEKVKTCYNNIR